MSKNKEFDEELLYLKNNFYYFLEHCDFNENTAFYTLDFVNKAHLICDTMQKIYESKDTDYACDGKPMGNLRSSEDIGVPAWKGTLVRIGDKKNRLKSFASRGTYAVSSEKVEDTLEDIANYCILGLLLFREVKHDENIVDYVLVEDAYREISKCAVMLSIMYKENADKSFMKYLPQFVNKLLRKYLFTQKFPLWNESVQWQNLLYSYNVIAIFAKQV